MFSQRWGFPDASSFYIDDGRKELINTDSHDEWHSADQKYVKNPVMTVRSAYKFNHDVFDFLDLEHEDLFELDLAGYLLDGFDFDAIVVPGYYGDEFLGMRLLPDGKEKVASVQAYIDFKNMILSQDEYYVPDADSLRKEFMEEVLGSLNFYKMD